MYALQNRESIALHTHIISKWIGFDPGLAQKFRGHPLLLVPECLLQRYLSGTLLTTADMSLYGQGRDRSRNVVGGILG